MIFDMAPAGTPTASLVQSPEVGEPAIIGNAGYVSLIHDHPSGDPRSSQDLALARRLEDVGALLGIRVLDHIVIPEKYSWSPPDDGIL